LCIAISVSAPTPIETALSIADDVHDLEIGGSESDVELNHISEHLIAVRAGVGIAGLPCFLGDRENDLVRIQQDAPSFSREIWLVVHRDLRNAPTVRAVMDFVVAVVTEHHDLSIR
jgi:DNA-binding transcriptional LysR family regulator